jgi:mRNA interferase MazF
MQAGEIYLAHFPFGDKPGMKLRPVLLLTGRIGPLAEVVVAYISSVLPSEPLPSDVIIDPHSVDYRDSNLKVVSALRLHKLATLNGPTLVRLLGRIGPPQYADISGSLRAVFGH